MALISIFILALSFLYICPRFLIDLHSFAYFALISKESNSLRRTNPLASLDIILISLSLLLFPSMATCDNYLALRSTKRRCSTSAAETIPDSDPRLAKWQTDSAVGVPLVSTRNSLCSQGAAACLSCLRFSKFELQALDLQRKLVTIPST